MPTAHESAFIKYNYKKNTEQFTKLDYIQNRLTQSSFSIEGTKSFADMEFDLVAKNNKMKIISIYSHGGFEGKSLPKGTSLNYPTFD